MGDCNDRQWLSCPRDAFSCIGRRPTERWARAIGRLLDAGAHDCYPVAVDGAFLVWADVGDT